MVRLDLVALTDAVLTQLATVGQVKRALRELAAGACLKLTQLEDGSVTALFADGAQTRLPVNQLPKNASCTCPSATFCQHRIMLALAYREQFKDADGVSVNQNVSWDPASLNVDAFEATLGVADKRQLKRLLESSIHARLERGQTPIAHLPMATVRFLVPNTTLYALCDCKQEHNCMHVALALRAFGAANGSDSVNIGNLGKQVARKRAVKQVATTESLISLQQAVEAVIVQLLNVGVIAGTVGHAHTLEFAQSQAKSLGTTQALLMLDALTEQIRAYEHRSSRYDESTVLDLVAQLYACTHTSDMSNAVGMGEPFETELAKSRLVSLGMRLLGSESEIYVCAALADPDTGAVMALENVIPRFTEKFGDKVPIRQRQILPSITIESLGRGQLITSVAKRRADGLLTLKRNTGGKTQIMPRDATINSSSPLVINDLKLLAQRIASRPLSLTRRRSRIENFHVFDVQDVVGQSWSAGGQVWQAVVHVSGCEEPLFLKRAFDVTVPEAISTLKSALSGKHGKVRQIAGSVQLKSGSFICDPWSVTTDRLIIPDIDVIEHASVSEDIQILSGDITSWERALQLLSGALHAGRRAWSNTTDQIGSEIVDELKNEGFAQTADLMLNWLSDSTTNLTAFGQAAVWLIALQESH
jgi:hypothetical protein